MTLNKPALLLQLFSSPPFTPEGAHFAMAILPMQPLTTYPTKPQTAVAWAMLEAPRPMRVSEATPNTGAVHKPNTFRCGSCGSCSRLHHYTA